MQLTGDARRDCLEEVKLIAADDLFDHAVNAGVVFRIRELVGFCRLADIQFQFAIDFESSPRLAFGFRDTMETVEGHVVEPDECHSLRPILQLSVCRAVAAAVHAGEGDGAGKLWRDGAIVHTQSQLS